MCADEFDSLHFGGHIPDCSALRRAATTTVVARAQRHTIERG